MKKEVKNKRIVDLSYLDKLPGWISFAQKLWKTYRKGNGLKGECLEQSVIETGEEKGKQIYHLIEKWGLMRNRATKTFCIYMFRATFTNYTNIADPYGELKVEFVRHQQGRLEELIFHHYYDHREESTPIYEKES